jgi:hypothetical protein
MSQDADKRRTATVKQTVQQRRKSIDTCGEEQQRKESSILELLYHRKIKQPAWTAQTTHMDSKVRPFLDFQIVPVWSYSLLFGRSQGQGQCVDLD